MTQPANASNPKPKNQPKTQRTKFEPDFTQKNKAKPNHSKLRQNQQQLNTHQLQNLRVVSRLLFPHRFLNATQAKLELSF